MAQSEPASERRTSEQAPQDPREQPEQGQQEQEQPKQAQPERQAKTESPRRTRPKQAQGRPEQGKAGHPRSGRRRPERQKPQKPQRPQRPYVRDARGPEAAGRFDTPQTVALMGVLALLVGFAVGIAVDVILRLQGWLTSLVWQGVGDRLGFALFPLVACTVGGVLIGAWTTLTHVEIDELTTIIGHFKRTGSYRLENPPATVVSFMLPLVFGGSIGFEAGITGILCSACCWVRDRLKAAGLKLAGIADVTIAASISAIFGTPLAGLVSGFESEGRQTLAAEVAHIDDYDMRREAKMVLYLAAAIGAFGGIAFQNFAFGGVGGMPRFGQIEAHGTEYAWSLVAMLAAWALLQVFQATKGLVSFLADLVGRHRHGALIKPIACGAILGAVALVLPLVLFPGEEQCTQLIEGWQFLPWGYLLASGIAKAVVTPLCIHMGWKGGDLFPAIFSGVSVGFALAAITGADPMLMVTVTTTAFLAGVTGKPILALGILALCFPLRGILWMGLAALVGAGLPVWHPFEGKAAKKPVKKPAKKPARTGQASA